MARSSMVRAPHEHYGKEDIQYRFYRLYSVDLDSARYSLRMLRRYRRSDIRFCILRDLIVSYARPFSGNKGPTGGEHSLSVKYVPTKHRPLHSELIDLRRQVFAHTDFTYHDPRLSKWDTAQGPRHERRLSVACSRTRHASRPPPDSTVVGIARLISLPALPNCPATDRAHHRLRAASYNQATLGYHDRSRRPPHARS